MSLNSYRLFFNNKILKYGAYAGGTFGLHETFSSKRQKPLKPIDFAVNITGGALAGVFVASTIEFWMVFILATRLYDKTLGELKNDHEDGEEKRMEI